MGNLKAGEGFDPIRSVSNFFVRSESRCKAIKTLSNYQLTADKTTALPQKKVTDRKQVKLQVSENPEAYFQIWDGDFVLGEYQSEADLINQLNFEINIP